MTTRQATVLVADEVTYTLNGKLNVFGIYTNDIHIPVEPSYTTQLVFLFIIETSPDDPYQKLELHVELPGGDSRHLPLGLSQFELGRSDQRRWCLKYPLLFNNPILRPGPIDARVIHEHGEISTAAPFIVLAPRTAPIPERAKH
jgi:hypothetical protein